MIELIQGLLDRGVAYLGEDGSVYFAIARFPGVRPAVAARPPRAPRGRQRAGERRRVQQGGRARLRALEGGASRRTRRSGAAWDAPFGRGRPGWHIECSAMALELIRRQLGHRRARHPRRRRGSDLPAPRGRDRPELRVHRAGRSSPGYGSTASSSTSAATKMSKRFGNITTARDLREDGVDPGAVRLLMFQVHYRKQLDLTDEALASAREGSRRLGEFQNRLFAATGTADGPLAGRGRRAARARAGRGAGRRPERPARRRGGLRLREGRERGARRG